MSASPDILCRLLDAPDSRALRFDACEEISRLRREVALYAERLPSPRPRNADSGPHHADWRSFPECP